MNVLETFHISPPPNTVEKTYIPLTFFDIIYLEFPPMQRIFFYEYPHPLNVFLQKILPGLKHSLSLTLQHFFPFASKLICPPPPHLPYISYSGIDDSVPLVIAVADASLSFDHLVENHVRDVKELHPFVPGLTSAQVLQDGTRVVPLLAVQITVFPSSGICIGFTFNHAVADGRAFIHFVKSWASVCLHGDLTFIENSLPCHDRDMIQDPNGIALIYLDFWSRNPFLLKKVPDIYSNKVRAKFMMSNNPIQNMKHLISRQNESCMSLHASSFVVTCAFVWTCIMKAQEYCVGETQNGNKIEHLVFLMDCRNRLEVPMPITYFGNCLAIGFVSVKREELLGNTGILAAARGIGSRIKEMENGALRDAEKWLEKVYDVAADVVIVAASPKFRVYETDFGWGKPRKTEVVHIDKSRTLGLDENRDEEGGVEVSLALSRDEMEVFKSMFQDGLNLL